MHFKVNNDAGIDGTALLGGVDVSYQRIVDVFGQPNEGDGYKVDAEWIIQFSDGLVATIYNYKSGKNYNGNEGQKTEEITDWHIGGKDPKVVKRVTQLLGRDTMSTRKTAAQLVDEAAEKLNAAQALVKKDKKSLSAQEVTMLDQLAADACVLSDWLASNQ
jgi:hypothetical protein